MHKARRQESKHSPCEENHSVRLTVRGPPGSRWWRQGRKTGAGDLHGWQQEAPEDAPSGNAVTMDVL